MTDRHYELCFMSKGTLDELRSKMHEYEDRQRRIRQSFGLNDNLNADRIAEIRQTRSKYSSSDESSNESDEREEDRKPKYKKGKDLPKSKPRQPQTPKLNEEKVKKVLKQRLKNINFIGGRYVVPKERIPDSVKESKYYFGFKHYCPDPKAFTNHLKEARREVRDDMEKNERNNRRKRENKDRNKKRSHNRRYESNESDDSDIHEIRTIEVIQ